MLKSMQEVLEHGFDVLNNVYFNNDLPPIVITIMSSPKSNGHFTLGRVWKAEDSHLNEINISAEHLNRPIENIMATMCHEMVHFFCQLNGINDVSQNGRYHNGKFKVEAEKRGLIITQGQYIGWSITEPSSDFINTIRTYGIEKPLEINRDGQRLISVGGNGGGIEGVVLGPDGLPIAKKKTSTRKYDCPCCGNTFRATKDINVMCMDCMEQYIKVEK